MNAVSVFGFSTLVRCAGVSIALSGAHVLGASLDGGSGYRAKSSDVATVEGRSLQVTPFAIDVIDGSFLRDMGVIDLSELRGSLGYEDGLSVRGRYGLVGDVDPLNVERVEILRGPSSLLYGVYEARSSLVNVVTKRPGEVAEYEVSVSGGDDGYNRATVEATAPIYKGSGDRVLAYRVAGAYDELGLSPVTDRDHEMYVGQLSYDDARWSVLLEGEFFEDTMESTYGESYRREKLDDRDEVRWLVSAEYAVTDDLVFELGGSLYTFDQDNEQNFVSEDYENFDSSGVNSDTRNFYLRGEYGFELGDFIGGERSVHHLAFEVREVEDDYLLNWGSDVSEDTYESEYTSHVRIFTYEGSFLEDRLNVWLGTRNTDLNYHSYNGSTIEWEGSMNGEWLSYLGLGFALNESVSVYVNRADEGKVPLDYGVKFELLGGKLNARLGAYERSVEDPEYGVYLIPELVGVEWSGDRDVRERLAYDDIYDTWNEYVGRAYGDKVTHLWMLDQFDNIDFYEGAYIPSVRVYGTSVEEIEGVEMNLEYVVDDSWSLLLDYRREEAETRGRVEDVNFYLDPWMQTILPEAYRILDADGDGVLDEGTSIPSVGSPLNNSNGVRDNGSLYVHYKVGKGTFDGFSALLGVVYKGKDVFVSDKVAQGLPWIEYRFPERYKLNLGLKYEWDMSHASYRLQLNVDNLLDDQRGTGVTTIDENRWDVPVYYKPVSYRLSVSAMF